MLASSLWRPLCAVLLIELIPLVCAQRHSLVQRAVTSSTSSEQAAPTPLSIAASQVWDGPDGPWSSFTIRVGTPEKDYRVLISTASQQTWVILPDGCKPADGLCPGLRGGTFTRNDSSTWSPLGNDLFKLSIEENLNISQNAYFGLDTVGLGSPGSGGPTLQHQLLGTIATEIFYLGMFGVNPNPKRFPGIDEEEPSYMTSLKNQGIIPSLSFGYTAGAYNPLNQVFGSLTLGGYDESRFAPNELTFSLAPDNSRDLVVGVQKITSISKNGTAALLTSGILAYVDSTVPQIWLPIEACQAFENAFGLEYDEEAKKYLVGDALHDALIAQNANITFTLGQLETGGETIDITLPYASFDLRAIPPFVLNGTTRYFPLQRATNDTQYTLGRAFFQEAYLIVDWERRNFSLSQCIFDENSPQKIVAIASASTSTSTSTSPDRSETKTSGSNGGKIGIGVGVALAVVAVAGLLAFIFLRRCKRQKKRGEKQRSGGEPGEVPQFEKAELNANDNAIHEKGDHDKGKHENDARRPKMTSPQLSWTAADEEALSNRGGISNLGHELSSDQAAGRGLSPSDPLLGKGAPTAAPYELAGVVPSELPASSSQEITKDDSATSVSGLSPLSGPGSSFPSSLTSGFWSHRRGTRSSTGRSQRGPSSPTDPHHQHHHSHPSELPSSPVSVSASASETPNRLGGGGEQHEGGNGQEQDPNRGRDRGSFLTSFFRKSILRSGRSPRET